MKQLFKRLFKTAFFRWLICFLAANYIRFVHLTSRARYAFHEQAVEYMQGKRPVVFAFWHGRLLMIPKMRPPGRSMNVLISTHRDGEMIARTMHHFGFATIRGSSTRGGANAARGALRALKLGENVAVTPDGPKGPSMKLQPGVVTIAAIAGVPVIPLTFSCTRYKRMKTWDRFLIALPFGTIYYFAGPPMRGDTPEALEAALIRQAQEADAKTGVQ